MRRALSAFLVVSEMSAWGAVTKTESVTFARYPATHVELPSPRKEPMINRGDGMFRTRLRRISDGKPNFADHMRLEVWGCGSSCIQFGVADLTTGTTYLFPETLSTPGDGRRLKFERSSKAVHVVGVFNEKRSADRWYAWTGSALKLVRDTPLPEECFSPAEQADTLLPTAKCNYQPPAEEIDGQPGHTP